MKKILFAAIMAFSTLTMSAQDSKTAVGVNFGFAPSLMKEYNPMILGAKFQYGFVENIRGEVAANIFTKKDGYGLWDAELNFHYLFPLTEEINVYPAAGAVFMGTMITDADKNYTGIGFNAGAGIDYRLTETIKLNAEIKYLGVSKKDSGYKVIDARGVTFAIGVAYCF